MVQQGVKVQVVVSKALHATLEKEARRTLNSVAGVLRTLALEGLRAHEDLADAYDAAIVEGRRERVRNR